jgi:hypothetical protein
MAFCAHIYVKITPNDPLFITDIVDPIINETLHAQSDEYYWWMSEQNNIRYYEALVAIRYIYPSNNSGYYKMWVLNSLDHRDLLANVSVRKLTSDEFDAKAFNIQLKKPNVHIVNTTVQQPINQVDEDATED